MNMPKSKALTDAAARREISPSRPGSSNNRPARQRRPRRLRGLSGLSQSCASALQSVLANKTRSLLTALGIIIGVGAVIAIVSVSEGSTASIRNRHSTLNPTEIIIRPGSASAAGGIRQGAGTVQTLTQADADAIASQVPNVSAVSPIVTDNGQAVFENQNWSTSIQGVYPNYQQIDSWTMQYGSFFSSEQGSYAVIGQTVLTNLFTPVGIVDPVGQQIRVGGVPFTIVGVLNAKGSSGLGNADDVVYVPFLTAQQQLVGHTYVNSIDVTADNTSDVDTVQTAVQQLLEQRHNITNSANDDFTIQNQSSILSTVQSTLRL
jgi:putative ABC transport system permease protein